MLPLEKIDEINYMCSRDNPIYEQISNYSIALYVVGCSEAQDLMAVEDMDICTASEKLREHFKKIEKKEIPLGYSIAGSKEKYLLVLGDTSFPEHFAVVADTKSKAPFFSKLENIGSGYDSLEELLSEYSGENKIRRQDIHYFKKI